MGTTSQKLTYLNDTKALLKDSINSIGGNITSQTTFRDYATQLENIYQNLPKVSGSGSNIQLTPTRKGRITSQINGDTFQQTYTGKNLFNKELAVGGINSTTGANITNSKRLRTVGYIDISSSTTYTISCTSTKTIQGVVYEYDENEEFLQLLSSTFTTFPFTFTTSANAKKIRFVFKDINETNMAITDMTNIQLELGSSATSYEPYVGGIASPNPSYPQTIQSVTGLQNVSVCGKNRIDNTNLNYDYSNVGSQYNSLSTIETGIRYTTTSSGTPVVTFKLMDLTPYIGKTIRLKSTFGNGGTIRIARSRENAQYITGDVSTSTSGETISFVVPENLGEHKYLCYSLKITTTTASSVDFTNLILTIDNEDMTYEAFSGETYPINLGTIELNEIDNYKNYIVGTPNNWSITGQPKIMILDGTETWWYDSRDTANYSYRCTRQGHIIASTLLCSHYPYASITNSNTNQGIDVRDQSNNWQIRIRWGQQDTIENFQEWLSNHNVKLLYVSTTEDTTPITDETLISQLNAWYYAMSKNGQTNISVDGNLPAILDVSALKYTE